MLLLGFLCVPYQPFEASLVFFLRPIFPLAIPRLLPHRGHVDATSLGHIFNASCTAVFIIELQGRQAFHAHLVLQRNL